MIPMILLISQIKTWGKLDQEFISYDQKLDNKFMDKFMLEE